MNKSSGNTGSSRMKRLVSDMLDRLKPGMIGKPYVLILGAGASIASGVKSWKEMCRDICMEEEIDVQNEDYVEAYKKLLDTERSNKARIFNRFLKNLDSTHPSIGYMHLAQLIKAGVIKTVITTNFDNILENVLYQMIPADQIKVFVRGEVSDQKIADYLNIEIPTTATIIKIHGDLRSNIFFVQDQDTYHIDTVLSEAIKSQSRFGSIIIGSSLQDKDLCHIICAKSTNYVIDPNEMNMEKLDLLGWKGIQDVKSKFFKETFDEFLITLNRAIQRGLIRDKLKKFSKNIEKKILEDSTIEKGSNYLKIVDITSAISRFMTIINQHYPDQRPDIIGVIHDPKAPGGLELYRHLRRNELFKKRYDDVVEIVNIKQGKTRYDARRVGEIAKKKKKVSEILILDVITFTGNTLKMVADKYREVYRNAVITAAVMYKSKNLEDQEKASQQQASDYGKPGTPSSLSKILSSHIVSRPEVIFPWGITQATEKFTKQYSELDPINDRHTPAYEISIEKRNWGSIEAFATQRYCSVRILTIEPWQELSFQRHIGRDEFFISLDDNIGLEISANELYEFQKKSDFKWHEITDVQSIVLEKGDCFLIPKGVWHRTRAFHNRVRLMEISYGIYDQDNDIERLYDMYNTPDRPRNLIP